MSLLCSGVLKTPCLDAMMKVNSIYAPREMPQKIWLLRSAFDALVDELTDEGIEG